MLASKAKQLFVEIDDFSILTAVASGASSSMRLESLDEYPLTTPNEEFHDSIRSRTGLGKNTRGYVPAHCAVYPTSRFIRRVSLEQPNKAKEPSFFEEYLRTQLRIDPDANTAAVLNVETGTPFTLDKPMSSQKELILCGGKTDELRTLQERMVAMGLYPRSLQLGSLSTLRALMDYEQYAKLELPTLLLEVTPANTHLFIFHAGKLDVSRPIPYGLSSMFPLIRNELGLKDEESARKLFYSNTFDFTEMGPALLQKMLKELQASTGFYEVQTGQTIGQILASLLPGNFQWMTDTLAKSLGVDVLEPDLQSWLESRGIKIDDSVSMENLGARWFGLLSLLGEIPNHSENGQKK